MVCVSSNQQDGSGPATPPAPPPYPTPQQTYSPPPGWQGHPPYYPPPKKKLSGAAILAIILVAILLLVAIAAVVYFLVLKGHKQTQPTLPPATTTLETKPVETTVPTTPEPTETEPEPEEPEPELSAFAGRVLALDAYEAQHLGANPVYYYQHPDLDIAIDFRGQEEAARTAFVFPTKTGFWVTHRQAISYEYGTLRDYPAGMDVAAITVQIDLLSESEEQAAIADIVTRRLQGEDVLVEWVRVKDGVLYVRDNMSGGPDPAWYAKELYGSPVFLDHLYLSQFLVESPQPGPVIEEISRDADDEWQRIVSMLQTNPARFEWRYAMPPYAKDPAAGINLPNSAFVEDLLTVPIYEYGSIDLDGDGIPEHLVHCCCDSYDYIERYGYWAIFTETPYGLRLIGFVGSGESDLIYHDQYFYLLQARGQGYDNSLSVEEFSIPVTATELRTHKNTFFLTLEGLIAFQAEGADLDEWVDWMAVPKLFEDDMGHEYLEYFVIDPYEYWGLVNLLDEGLSGQATVVPIRTPYTITPGEQVIELQAPYVLGDLVDYLATHYSFFPFTEADWFNAILVEDILALGAPLTYDKADALLPYPELVGK